MSHRVSYEPFAAHIWGIQVYVIENQRLLKEIFRSHAASLSYSSIRWYLLVNVFGANKSHHAAFLAVDEDAYGCLETLKKSPKLHALIHKMASKTQEEAPGLVSSSQSIVDQNFWERFANPEIAHENTRPKGKSQAVEVDMFALVRHFVGYVTTSSLAGSNILEVQPRILEQLWNLESKWRYMLLGLPRWLPIPGLPKAYIARRELHHTISSFHESMNNYAAGEALDSAWSDLEDASALFKDRNAVWRAHRTPADVKASADLSLLWAANVKPSCLIFWMLIHIFSSPGLVEKIRTQISPHIAATQPPNTFGIPEPPRLEIKDIECLVGACPLLKACFYECSRLYSKPLAVRKVTRSLTVTAASSENIGPPVAQHFTMRSGSYLAAPLDLHSQGNSSFEAPQLFKPSRFLSTGPDGKQKCAMGMLRLWGLGEAACPGRWLAEKQVLIFVAAIVSLWDIEPLGSKHWKIPKDVVYSVIAVPKADIRVLFRARKLSSG